MEWMPVSLIFVGRLLIFPFIILLDFRNKFKKGILYVFLFYIIAATISTLIFASEPITNLITIPMITFAAVVLPFIYKKYRK